MDESFPSSLNILEKDYDDAIRNKGELDERVFINEEDSLLGSGSLSGSSMNTSGVKVCFGWVNLILQKLYALAKYVFIYNDFSWRKVYLIPSFMLLFVEEI